MKLKETHPIGIGTFMMGGDYDLEIKKDIADYDNDAACIEAIRHSIDLGQNHIDTAYSYGAGHTEEIVRAAIKGYAREKLYIADKLPKSHMRRSAVVPAIRIMLQRLGLDYIDLMYIHDVNAPEPMEGYLAGLAEAVDLGLIKEIGISNANLEQTKQAVALCKYPIVANQIQLNIIDRKRAPQDLLDYCESQNIAVVSYQPLQNPVYFNGLDNEAIIALAKKYNKTVQQIGLNWLIKHKKTIAIPKATMVEHIDSNFESLNFEISAEDLKFLDSLV